MKRSIARKWAKALDSGDYKQTKGFLRNTEGFCCLGVLCNLHAQANPEFAVGEQNPYSYGGSVATTPEVVMQWANLGDENPNIDEEVYGESSLAELNDKGGTFPEIAKIIRKHWKEL